MHNQEEMNKEEMEFKSDSTHIDEELKAAADEMENKEETATVEENVREEDKLKAELTSVQDKYLRLYSEFENYKNHQIHFSIR